VEQALALTLHFGKLSLDENNIDFNDAHEVILNPKCNETSTLKFFSNFEGKECSRSSTLNLKCNEASTLKSNSNFEDKKCNVDENFNL
jgi:hypothetical protein